MKAVLTPTEMRQADLAAINDYGISGFLLMENAARSAADYIRKITRPNQKVTIFCGSGNNGGDGFALARHLSNQFEVEVFYIGDKGKMSPETKLNFEIANKICKVIHLNSDSEIEELELKSNIIIDALIGVGGSHNLKGLVIPILQKCNSLTNALKIAIDCPTGLNSLTGEVSEFCFKADHTITMYAIKTGMILGKGPDYCGKIYIADLGAPESILFSVAKTFIMEDSDLHNLLPKRKRVSSKFDYGRLLIVAGSKNMPGASALTANSAIKSGTGLVHLITATVHPSLLPEIIPITVPLTDAETISSKSIDCIISYAEKCDCIAIGPGLGDNEETLELVNIIIEKYIPNKKIVVDADGIKAISKDRKYSENLIITPHTGEFSKLIGIDRELIESDPIYYAKLWAEKMNCIIHLKYVPSITTNGEKAYINISGNPGMATAGSGDVLTGIISSLSAQGMDLLIAGALGAFIHSKAGDSYKQNFSEFTLTASSLITYLEEVFRI